MGNTRLDYEELGFRIQHLREKRGCTRDELALVLDVSVEHVARLEAGTIIPDLDSLLIICDRLGVVPERLLFDRDELSRLVFKDLVASYLYSYDNETVGLLYEVCQQVYSQRESG